MKAKLVKESLTEKTEIVQQAESLLDDAQTELAELEVGDDYSEQKYVDTMTTYNIPDMRNLDDDDYDGEIIDIFSEWEDNTVNWDIISKWEYEDSPGWSGESGESGESGDEYHDGPALQKKWNEEHGWDPIYQRYLPGSSRYVASAYDPKNRAKYEKNKEDYYKNKK